MSNRGVIKRQIKLPFSKAVEIAWKSIRLRLGRSMLVTSAIVLALAFLCAILTTQSLIDGMRAWVRSAPRMPEYQADRAQRDALEERVGLLENDIRVAVQSSPKPPPDAKPFDVRAAFGAGDWDAIKNRLARPLPASAGELNKLLAARPEMIEPVRQLIHDHAELKTVRARLNLPEELKSQMAGHGVPTEPEAIEAGRIQTRWIITLALLVAFIGILNAMLMSVTERFREIGTMKCLGALNGFIVKLFLLESLFQGAAGTVMGIVLGLGVSFGMTLLSYGNAAFFNVPWNEIGLNILITLIVGMALTVGGAILPALQAARMEPIAAMRVEA